MVVEDPRFGEEEHANAGCCDGYLTLLAGPQKLYV